MSQIFCIFVVAKLNNNPLKFYVMKNKKLQLIVAAMQYSHPHYLGEEFHMSIQFDGAKGFYVIFFMSDAYKSFITDYAFEVFSSIARLFNVSVGIRVRHGLPVITMSYGSYC